MTTATKKLKSSTRSTKKVCTRDEILDIIKLCSSEGVKSIKYNGLELEFYEKSQDISTYGNATSFSHEDAKLAELESDQERQTAKKSHNLATLHITDPLAFEEELVREDNLRKLEEEVEGITHGTSTESDDEDDE